MWWIRPHGSRNGNSHPASYPLPELRPSHTQPVFSALHIHLRLFTLLGDHTVSVRYNKRILSLQVDLFSQPGGTRTHNLLDQNQTSSQLDHGLMCWSRLPTLRIFFILNRGFVSPRSALPQTGKPII